LTRCRSGRPCRPHQVDVHASGLKTPPGHWLIAAGVPGRGAARDRSFARIATGLDDCGRGACTGARYEPFHRDEQVRERACENRDPHASRRSSLRLTVSREPVIGGALESFIQLPPSHRARRKRGPSCRVWRAHPFLRSASGRGPAHGRDRTLSTWSVVYDTDPAMSALFRCGAQGRVVDVRCLRLASPQRRAGMRSATGRPTRRHGKARRPGAGCGGDSR